LQCGKPESAIDELQRQIALDPSFPPPHLFLGLAYLRQGNPSQAITALEKVRGLSPGTYEGLGLLGFAYARAGRTNDAQKILTQLLASQEQSVELRVDLALVQHSLGANDEALALLEKAADDHEHGLESLSMDPSWNELRPNPRFQAILRRMKLIN
jgi:serine/threonine-protein kinase